MKDFFLDALIEFCPSSPLSRTFSLMPYRVLAFITFMKDFFLEALSSFGLHPFIKDFSLTYQVLAFITFTRTFSVIPYRVLAFIPFMKDFFLEPYRVLAFIGAWPNLSHNLILRILMRTYSLT